MVGDVKQKSEEDFVIRIKATRVAQLMDMVGQLGLSADAVLHHPDVQAIDSDEINIAGDKLHAIIRDLQDIASGLRLVPIETVFLKMQRLARDLSKQTGKHFTLDIQGAQTEIDKVVVDMLSDPLIHIIRNAVDHGLEPNETRIALGKTDDACISLYARQEGGDIHIQINDNGSGLNRERILARAIEKGMVRKDQSISDEKLWPLIFHPGFSTKEDISELSGRGVGMDVVKTTIDYLRGRIEINSVESEGTRICLIIPLNVAFLNVMIFDCQGKLYAISIETVIEAFQSVDGEIVRATAEHLEHVKIRDKMVPIISLAGIHNSDSHIYDNQDVIFIIAAGANGEIAIPVDRILGQFQVAVKPLTGYLKSIKAVSSCVLLPSGEVAWVLDPSQILFTKKTD